MQKAFLAVQAQIITEMTKHAAAQLKQDWAHLAEHIGMTSHPEQVIHPELGHAVS